MNMRQELDTILQERLKGRKDGNGFHPVQLQPHDAGGVPVETLLTELKQMPLNARMELVLELFGSIQSRIERTALLVKLSDAVNK